MNSGFFRAVLAAMLALCPCSATAAAFEPGQRPAGAVFDPAGVFDVREKEAISLPLEEILKDGNVQVMVVVLSETGSVAPEETAAGFAAAWCHAPLHAVVLHVPGLEGSPWIVAGGDIMRSLDSDEVRDELAAARRDATREPDDLSKVRTAANATADMLRFWKGREATRLKVIESIRADIRRELETQARRQQVFMLTVAVTAIALMAGILLAIRLLGKVRHVTTGKP